jgi:hypothetical protein
MQERTRYLRRPRRTRWQRWVESIDLWHPRPIDYVLIAGGFLVVSLLWIGERTSPSARPPRHPARGTPRPD